VPSVNSPKPTNNNVSFYTGSCVATVGNTSTASIVEVANMGPLTATNNPVASLKRVINTPDGKYYVRVIALDNAALSTLDI
jgi:hypothetical protein